MSDKQQQQQHETKNPSINVQLKEQPLQYEQRQMQILLQTQQTTTQKQGSDAFWRMTEQSQPGTKQS
jgi:hypothetical protein